jgi:hypothetical protein
MLRWGVTYGEASTEAPRRAAHCIAVFRKDMLQLMNCALKNCFQEPEHTTLVSAKLALDVAGQGSPQRARIADLFRSQQD